MIIIVFPTFLPYYLYMKRFSANFVGRENEIKELEKCYNSGRSEFLSVYGRRRVGKTFLIRNMFSDEFSFYVSGVINGNLKEELSVFCNALKEYGYNGSLPLNWMDAFSCLDTLIKSKEKEKRCIVFIDEISSFDTPRSNFIRALEYFWNVKGSCYDNLLFIISGSATHWVVNKVINDRGGLHNRVTKQMHIKPFKLKEVEEYGKKYNSSWSRLQYIEMYSVLGGIPFYWDKIDFELTVEENIDNLFFSRDAEMVGEYSNLYRSLFKKPEPYIAVIKALASKGEGLTRKEIIDKSKIQSGAELTQLLTDLENCDFIRSYNRKNKSNNSIYQLIDFFTLFYLNFHPYMKKDGLWWRKNMLAPQINTWYGLSFERICVSHIEELLFALHLDSINTQVYSWRSSRESRGAQIDIVIDRADNIITFCEVKYSRGLYHLTKEEYLKLQNRIEMFQAEEKGKIKKGIQYVLITNYGLSQSQYNSIFSKVITFDSLF